MKHWILIIVLLLVLPTAAAQEIPPALLEQIERIETFTQETRDLDILEPVDRQFPGRAEAIEEIKAMIAAEIPPEEAERYTRFYVAFDFMPPGSDYMAAYLEALEAQVGGFYDTETKAMNTLLLSNDELGDELPLFEQIIYTHEFVHALQDQHFDLTALEEYIGENPDRVQAFRALIEGDATLVMNVYTQEISARNPLGTAMQLLAQGLRTNTLTLPPGLPDIVASELLTAYTSGAAFVGALQSEGGWELVNSAFQPENLPQSTEQILHPHKYISGEGPLPVDLTDPTLTPAWETIWDTTFGEFYLREYLKTQLSISQATAAAAGWGGDNYHVYHNTETGELAWLMRIEWDTPEEAAEFTSAYTTFIGERFEGVAAQDSCWSTAAEALCFIDDTVSVTIAFAPALAMAQDLIASHQ